LSISHGQTFLLFKTNIIDHISHVAGFFMFFLFLMTTMNMKIFMTLLHNTHVPLDIE